MPSSRPSGRAAPAAAPEVALQNPNGYPGLDLARTRGWLVALLTAIAPGTASFTARLVGARAMRRLNRDFRAVDRATDVLSFPGEEGKDGRHLGDVAICYPLALRQAAGEGHEVGEEISRLLLHGVLHCLGYDHETDDGQMAALERRLARRWIGTDA